MATRPEGTESFRFNHTMLRIKDPEVSLKWYKEVLGMTQIDKKNGGDFTLFFLAFPRPEDEGKSMEELAKGRASREGLIELTHNHGTEKEEGQIYHNGNKEPKGFGHCAITVDDVQATCDRFEKMGVTFQKRPSEGSMRNIAFVRDPDEYWWEVCPNVHH